VSSREEAEGYVALICFKHGPPALHGVELEWTIHHRGDRDRPVTREALLAALGGHAPYTLHPDPPTDPARPSDPLPHGSCVTVEPGGQVEISSPALASLPDLIDVVDADRARLDELLRASGLLRGRSALDCRRPPTRLLDVPRYAAMQSSFDAVGHDGSVMMCSTAGYQVCLDAGTADDVALRWHALHAVGPALVALFANSAYDGWRAARLRATFGTFPPFTAPPPLETVGRADPAAAWAALAMSAPVLCVRRDGDRWDAPAGLTFGDWVEHAGRRGTALSRLPRPTYADLDYHLSTLFPPVRAKGYVEVRYLDTQPDVTWEHPLLLLSALMSDRATTEAAVAAVRGSTDRWLEAARRGLDDEPVLEAASALVEIGAAALPRLGVDDGRQVRLVDTLERRIAQHAMRRHTA